MFLKIILIICVATVIKYSNAEDDNAKITEFLNKFANINVEEILSNDRLFQSYHKCFMETGPCTAEAKDMRAMIPALVNTSCEHCTDEQKKQLKKHLDYAKHKREKEWDELVDKYDPNREHLEKFLASVPN